MDVVHKNPKFSDNNEMNYRLLKKETKIRRKDFYCFLLLLFDRDFEPLAIMISRIRFHIHTPHLRKMLNSYFQLTA